MIATWASEGKAGRNGSLAHLGSKQQPAPDWMPVLTWMGLNNMEMNRHLVNILFNKLGSALCGGWGMWFITYKNLDSPWLNVKTLASVRKFMNFTHMIIDDLY